MLIANQFKGVGPKTRDLLAKLSIFTLQDLLLHLPLRYEDRTRLTPLAEIVAGDRVLVEGEIVSAHIAGRRASLTVCIQDQEAALTLRFFHFNAEQRKQLQQIQTKIRCFGEVRANFSGGFEMVHPEYRLGERCHEMGLSSRLTPIYPTTKGLSQGLLQKTIQQALTYLQQHPLPEYLSNTATLQEALHYVHEPLVNADQDLLRQGLHTLQQRIAFEELLAHELNFRQLRKKVQQDPAVVLNVSLQEKFIQQLAFQLTTAQVRVIAEIQQDLQKPVPMLRLVQGDVGSGKTVVAASAVLQAIASGYQAAVMAPTEILAQQHFQQFTQWLKPFHYQVGFLSGSQKKQDRLAVLQALASGDIHCLVGTHALFQEEVVFKNLALVVMDEQHRFGVQQRLALRQKGVQDKYSPHQLVMSATPIPRTLAMTAYADLDCSVIDELPKGRKPIQTVMVSRTRRQEIIERVLQNCLAGKQAYWVCTLIDESEVLNCQAAENTAQELRELLPNLSIGLVHGRMKPLEKEAVMKAFKEGLIHLLIATTVIEVGVDVPNACLMIIENPERLGLAQLHQLRGRVGRGSQESFCVMLYQAPLGQIARQRLQILRESQDGFLIAEEDLKMRGPGDILGEKQAGLMTFRIADLSRDAHLIPNVKNYASVLQQQKPEYVPLLLSRWFQSRGFYAQV